MEGNWPTQGEVASGSRPGEASPSGGSSSWRSQFSATGPNRPACQVLHMSPQKPIFLLAAGPLLLIGILFLWPLCLRNGLKSPADWPKSFLPPGGRADAMCLFYGMYLSYWTLLDFPHPPSPLWNTGSLAGHGRWASARASLPWIQTRGLGMWSLCCTH